VLVVSLMPRDIRLPAQVGLSNDGCEHQSPQELFLRTNNKKEKYFISIHQSDDYDNTQFLEGTLKQAK